MDIVGNSGEQKNLDSSITKEKVDISIISNFTLNASENKDLGLDVYIQNNSGKNINILLNDSIRRARILDRNGNSIYRTNSTEKVTIL